MLTVRPLTDPFKLTEIYHSFGKEYKDGEMAYYAAEVNEDNVESTENLLGLCVFSLKNGRDEIVYLEGAEGTNDVEALFIMGRTVMSFMHRCGIRIARLDPQINNGLADSLGFKRIGNDRVIDLDEFFDSPCNYLNKIQSENDK